MIRMTLADYAKIHGQAKAASDFGVIQCAISKAILAGRNIMVTLMLMRLVIAVLCVSWLLNIQTRLNPFVKAWDSLMKTSAILSAP